MQTTFSAEAGSEPLAAPSSNAMQLSGLFVLAGLLAAAAFAYVGDGDLWWQRALGLWVVQNHTLPTTLGSATFSAPDAAWVPHEWVFATLWALADRYGLSPIFRAGCALAVLAAVVIDDFRARAYGPRARITMSVLVVAGILWSFGPRAQIVAWPLLALLMLALESGPRRAWWAVPIALIWDNLHASGLIVPAVVLVFGIGRALTEKSRRALVLTFGLSLACLAASAVTPFGLHYAYFALSWSLNPATHLIAEWQPVSWSTAYFFSSALIIVALLVLGELRGARLSWSQRLVGAAFFVFALMHVRDLALFVIVAGPWTAASLAGLLPRPQHEVARMPRSDCGLVWLGALAALVIAALGGMQSRHDPADPTAAVERLVAEHRQARVACEDFSWCSRFAGSRDIRVFLDGRIDAYPPAVIADYRRLLAGDSRDPVARWQIDAVLARRDGALARGLRARGWRPATGGETQLLLLDRVPAQRAGLAFEQN